jgi:hypothetical protein
VVGGSRVVMVEVRLNLLGRDVGALQIVWLAYGVGHRPFKIYAF